MFPKVSGQRSPLRIGRRFPTIARARINDEGLSTQLSHSPAQSLAWLVRHWTIEVILEEIRAHLGTETQRQWSDLAIGRTTPALFGLYSLMTLLAQTLPRAQIASCVPRHDTLNLVPPSQTRWRW